MTTFKDKFLKKISIDANVFLINKKGLGSDSDYELYTTGAQSLVELVCELDAAFEAVYDAAPMYHGTKTDYVNSNELHRKIAKEARAKITKWAES